MTVELTARACAHCAAGPVAPLEPCPGCGLRWAAPETAWVDDGEAAASLQQPAAELHVVLPNANAMLAVPTLFALAIAARLADSTELAAVLGIGGLGFLAVGILRGALRERLDGAGDALRVRVARRSLHRTDALIRRSDIAGVAIRGADAVGAEVWIVRRDGAAFLVCDWMLRPEAMALRERIATWVAGPDRSYRTPGRAAVRLLREAERA